MNQTKLSEINMDNNIIFKINNVIEKINLKKYLGFIIDKELKMIILSLFVRESEIKIWFFKRIRNKMSTITSINIYNTIIKPYLEFGSTILHTYCSNQQITRLQKLQNKAMRTILKVKRLMW